jgi:UDP-glucose 4-epimerase
VWLDEAIGPLAPRNIYGVTKLAAEGLCQVYWSEHGLPSVVLRTARFFPEDDDTHRMPSGENLKANEFLHRRLTVEDAADGHVAALDRAPALGFDTFILSAPTPFSPDEAAELKRDAAAVVCRHFPDAAQLYAARGWQLPASLGRVYDAGHAERRLGFRCRTGFAEVLAALQSGTPLPFAHDPAYVSPKEPRKEVRR